MHTRSNPIRGAVIGLMLSVPVWAVMLTVLYGSLASRPAQLDDKVAASGFTAVSVDANNVKSPG